MVNEGEELLMSEQNSGDANQKMYDELVMFITNGTYKEGDKIPSENELKEHYNLSRNSVRLVLNRLKTMGLIETRRGEGSYVRKPGANLSLQSQIPTLLYKKHDLLDLLEFRKGVEVEAVKLAAQRATEDDIKQMKSLLVEMKKNIMKMSEFAAVDEKMHVYFAKASKNEVFGSMVEIIQSILTGDMKELLVTQGMDIDSYFYHESILNCIQAKKPDEAAYMMEKHLQHVIERISGHDKK